MRQLSAGMVGNRRSAADKYWLQCEGHPKSYSGINVHQFLE